MGILFFFLFFFFALQGMIHLIVTKQAKWSKEKSKSKQFNLTLNQKCQIFLETVRTMEKAGDDTVL